MWTSPHIPRGRFTPKGEPSPPPPHVGRTILIGGVLVFAGLSGFYLNMLRNKRKQEQDGTNPFYEQVIARADTKRDPPGDINRPSTTAPELRQSTTPSLAKECDTKQINREEYTPSPNH